MMSFQGYLPLTVQVPPTIITKPFRKKENFSQGSGHRHRVRLRYRLLSGFKFCIFKTNSLSTIGQPDEEQLLTTPIDLFTRLIYASGSTNSRSNAVLAKPFPTSTFKVLTWIFATTTKICTKGRYTFSHETSFSATPTHTYSSKSRNTTTAMYK